MTTIVRLIFLTFALSWVANSAAENLSEGEVQTLLTTLGQAASNLDVSTTANALSDDAKITINISLQLKIIQITANSKR